MATMPQIPQLQTMESPVEQYGKWAALRSMLQQQQLQQQQLASEQQMQPLRMQQAQNTLTQQQMEISSEQAMVRAYNEAGGDLTKAVPLAYQYGALPKDVNAAVLQDLDARTKRSQLTTSQQDQAQKQMQALGQVSGALLQVPADQRPQALQQFMPQLNALQVNPSQVTPDMLTDDNLKHYQIASMKASEHLTQERDQAKFAQDYGPLGARQDQLQGLIDWRYQVLNPGKQTPPDFVLPPNATAKDWDRVDKAMNAIETAQGTAAQRATANAIRNQTFQLAKQAADETNYQHNLAELDRQFKPVTDALPRFQRLQTTLAQNSPQADALVAPELLTIMAGGAGSGLRMNEAEITRILGGRSKWQDLQAAAQKWSLDPTKASSITPEQRQQIRSLTDAVGQKMQQQMNVYSGARQQLLGTADPTGRRKIVSDSAQRSAQISAAEGGGGGTGGMIQEGQTATGPNGHKIMMRGGQLIDLTTNQPLAQ